MKETDDDKRVDISDGGAVPPTSTNPIAYDGIFKFAKAQREYYYTPNEWSRLGMQGPLPDKRNIELRGVKQDRRDDEKLSEDSDT